MRLLFVLTVFGLCTAHSCLAAPASTNVAARAVSMASSTNAPVVKSTCAKVAKDKLPRKQCEAITKSGTRCKRNAASGGKLCRQHQRIQDRNGSGP